MSKVISIRLDDSTYATLGQFAKGGGLLEGPAARYLIEVGLGRDPGQAAARQLLWSLHARFRQVLVSVTRQASAELLRLAEGRAGPAAPAPLPPRTAPAQPWPAAQPEVRPAPASAEPELSGFEPWPDDPPGTRYREETYDFNDGAPEPIEEVRAPRPEPAQVRVPAGFRVDPAVAEQARAYATEDVKKKRRRGRRGGRRGVR